MSQQHTTQASGQGTLERVFKLYEHGTTTRTEVIADLTISLMMVYIVFVNPRIFGVVGMDTSAVFVTIHLIAALGSILMGLFANLLVVLVPTMGLNAFFVFVVVGAMGLSWQINMGAIFRGATGLLPLTIFRVRYWMIANIPVSLRVGIINGIGLFTGMVGLKDVGIVVISKDTLVSIGNLTSHSILLGVLGFFIIATSASRNIHAAVLISVIITTLLGRMLDNVHYNGIVSTPLSVMFVIGHVDLVGSFNIGLAGVIFLFILVNLFNSSSMLTGVTGKAGLADAEDKFPCVKQALYTDSVSSAAKAFIGASSVIAYIESFSGVSVDGRTGLTVVVVSLLSLLVIFLSSLAGMVPGYAAVGALIYVGVLIISSLSRVEWDDLTEAAPAFITVAMMPFSFSITEGITLGFISYCVMKIGTGRLRDLNPCVIIVALLPVPKIVLIDVH